MDTPTDRPDAPDAQSLPAERRPDIPSELIANWQSVVDLLSGVLGVPTALLKMVDGAALSVVVSSDSEGNPFSLGDSAPLEGNSYCAESLRTEHPLVIRDARRDPKWRGSPALDHDLTFYIGYPIRWPDGEILGTVCIMDREENPNALRFQDLVAKFRDLLEGDLKALSESDARERSRETLLQTILDSVNDAVVIAKGDVLSSCNRKLLEVFGYSMDEVMGQPFWRFSSPTQADGRDSREVGREFVTQALQGRPQRFEWRFRRSDESLIDTEVGLSTVEIEGERQLLVIIHDVTERQETLEALREQETAHRALIRNIPGMIYRGRADRSIEIISGSEALCGYSPEELNRRPGHWLSLVHVSDRDRIAGEGEALVKERASIVQIYRIVDSLGAVRWVEDRKTSLFAEDGEFIGIDGVVFDITERKRTEIAVQNERDRAQSYLDITGVIMLVLNAKGEIELLNRAGCQLLGYKEDQIIGRDWFETCLPERERAEVREAFDRLMLGGIEPLKHYENPVLTSTGEVRTIAWHNTFIMDETGKITGTLSSGEDVTERRAAEAALTESEQRFRAMFEQAAVGVAQTVSRTGRLVRVNQKYCDIVGYTTEEMLGLTYQEITHPDDVEADLDSTRRILAGEMRSFSMEKRYVRKDGAIVWVNLTVSPMWEVGEHPEHHIAVVEDITERKLAEAALKESERRYRELVELMNDGLGVQDERGRVTYANKRLCEMAGRPLDEVVGKPVTDFLDEESGRAFAGMADRREAGTQASYEMTILRPDGGRVHALVSPQTLFGPTGRFAGSFGVVTDITERKRMENALRKSEENFRALAENANDGILIANRTGLHVYANSRAAEISGYTIDELLRLDFRGLAHPDEVPKVGDRFEKRHDGEEPPHRYETAIRHKDGTRVEIEVTAAVTTWHGEPATLVIIRDITQRKAAEQALRESESKFSGILSSMIDLVFVFDPDGRFSFCHAPTADDFYMSPESFLGRSAADVMPPHVSEIIAEGLEVNRNGRLLEREYRLEIPGRGAKWFSANFSPMMSGDDYAGSVAVVRDITERRRSEEERRKNFDEIARLKDELEQERDYLLAEVSDAPKQGEIIGDSPALLYVLAQVDAVSATNASVLLQGESGVGKELIARAIHEQSPRASKPLVRVNSASIPRDLFESEFFGHVKGAFTGAHRDRVGRFHLAHGGTLFLDEVAEIPPELQVKLLRVLQEGEFERVGEEVTNKVDVRVIAATNRDLRQEVERGRFREDLYYRLSVFPIVVPPLRVRRQDIVPLARHFLAEACREFDRPSLALSRAQAEELQRYEWPGNVRELQNVIERAAILSKGARLGLDLPLTGAASTPPAGAVLIETGSEESSVLTAAEMRRFERDNIVAAMERSGWKVSGKGGAAEILNVKPSTLRYQIKTLKIRRPG